MSCHFTGTTHPFFSDWNLDYDFTWSLAGDHWEWSGSYSNYTGAYTDPGQNLRGTVDGSNVQPFSGSCVQVPNGAVFWVNSAPLYHPFGGTPCGRYTPGPLVSLDTAMAAALAAAAAAGDWADSADCNMEVTTPNSETGNFTYALKQPKAHMTGLTIGQFYQLKFNYQKYISGVWTDAYTLIVGFTATATEEYTAWIDTSEMFSLFPGQVRLDPACPARLVPITGD